MMRSSVFRGKLADDEKNGGDDHSGNEIRNINNDMRALSSPTSVLAAQGVNPGVVIEPIVLAAASGHDGPLRCQQEETTMAATSTSSSMADEWICPASAKSIRTVNPIRAIVDPIVKNIQSGEDRGDGKDPISLAVSPIRSTKATALVA